METELKIENKQIKKKLKENLRQSIDFGASS